MCPVDPALLATYATNILRIRDPLDFDNTVLEVRPGHGIGTACPAVHVIGAWNPRGVPTPVGRNIATREALEYDVLAAGGSFAVGAAHAPDLSWAEETLVVDGLDDVAAARVAAGHGQPAFWRLTQAEAVVLRAADAVELARTPMVAQPLRRRPCVMPAHHPADGERCVRPGGPWVSRSRDVAAFFTRDRDALLTVLGCDVCSNGPVQSAPGRPLLLHVWSAASRYGPPQQLRQLTAEEVHLQ